jgi:hypothetical protein
MTNVDRFVDEITMADLQLPTEWLASAMDARARRWGEITVTDGPFTETKEVLVGYPLFQASPRRSGPA